MVRPPINVNNLTADHKVVSCASSAPTKLVAELPKDLAAQPAASPGTGRRVQPRERAIRQVVVVEAEGRLSDVVEDLDRAIQLALADGPRGVVCDLSAVLADAGPAAVGVLATAGRHVRDWPGIPVAVACPDPRVRRALEAHPLGGQLIVTSSLFAAVSAVLATPTLAIDWLHLTPHPTAPRASRDFVTRTLLDWRLGRVIPFASLVVTELVASSTVHAGTDLELSVAWHLDALRLTVRDHGPGLHRDGHPDQDLHGRGLSVVAGLSRAFGMMPAADGGKVVWAVLEAPRPRTWTSRIGSEGVKESPMFSDGRGLAGLPFCAGSTSAPAGTPTPAH